MSRTAEPDGPRRMSPDWRPMPLTDQRGAAAYAWFPEGTPVEPAHALPRPVYAEVCRLAGVSAGSPWVAFARQADALAAVVAAYLAAGQTPPG